MQGTVHSLEVHSLGRRGFECEGMQGAPHLPAQRVVNHLVLLNPGLAAERLGGDPGAEVIAVAGEVDDDDVRAWKRLFDEAFDLGLDHGHWRRSRSRSRPPCKVETTLKPLAGTRAGRFRATIAKVMARIMKAGFDRYGKAAADVALATARPAPCCGGDVYEPGGVRKTTPAPCEVDIHAARRRSGSCFWRSNARAGTGRANVATCTRICSGEEKIEVVILRERLSRVVAW